MITADKARKTILDNIQILGTEIVPLNESIGRVLSEPIISGRDVPPMDNSAMDGFGFNASATHGTSEKTPVHFSIVRTIPAGEGAGPPIGVREAVRIMTGAPVPKGADAVIPVEEAVLEKEQQVLRISGPVQRGTHIRYAGEDIRRGERILPVGRPLKAADIGLAASQGIVQLKVYRRPEVAILATGDEIIYPGDMPREGQIFGSNCHTLSALVRECGGVPRSLGIARDDPGDLALMIEDGLQSDALVTTGAVSMGDFDYLKDVFGKLGVEIVFAQVAQKPGKPMTFGIRDSKPVFGLPGNPVSAALGFELYVRPALRKMMGHRRLFRPTLSAVLQETIRKKPGRRHFVRGIISRGKNGEFHARATGEQGSGILRSMSLANGIIIIPEEADGIEAGENVEIYLLECEDALCGEGE